MKAKETDPEILKKGVFDVLLYAQPIWLNRFYSYSVGQYLVNVKILVPNKGVLQIPPKKVII
jgi:hypothetical protein